MTGRGVYQVLQLGQSSQSQSPVQAGVCVAGEKPCCEAPEVDKKIEHKSEQFCCSNKGKLNPGLHSQGHC